LSINARKIYVHGIEILLSSLLNVVLILAAGLIIKDILSSFVFLAVIVPLRQICGGYHAKTYFWCNFYFVSFFLAICLTSGYLAQFMNIAALSVVIICGFIPVYALSPIENENKNHFDENKKARLNKLSVIVYLAVSLCSVLLIPVSGFYAMVTALSLVAVSLLIVVEFLRKGGNRQ
jgi:accessory gene regulator B